jgi:hypothetical protein
MSLHRSSPNQKITFSGIFRLGFNLNVETYNALADVRDLTFGKSAGPVLTERSPGPTETVLVNVSLNPHLRCLPGSYKAIVLIPFYLYYPWI